MTYTPTWEPIAEALERVVATGLPKSDAQRDLCRAIADGRIAVRLHLSATRGLPARALFGSSLEIPPRLSPSDINWKRSRTSEGSRLWPGPSQRLGEPTTLYIRHNFDLMDRTVELIEVKVADVNQIFCDADGVKKPIAPKPAKQISKQAFSRGAKQDGVRQAISARWPSGIPKGLTRKDLCREIHNWLKDHNLSAVSDRTIQRVLQSLDP